MTKHPDPVVVDVQPPPDAETRARDAELQALARHRTMVDRAVRALERRELFTRWPIPAEVALKLGYPKCAHAGCEKFVAVNAVPHVDWRGLVFHVECVYEELRALARETATERLAA